MRWIRNTRQRPVVAWILLALGLWPGLLSAQSSAPATVEADQVTESQKFAAQLLVDMANYMAALPGFKVDLVSSYDVVQETGQKIEFNEIRQIVLTRPDNLRIELQMSNGAQDLILFDGDNINISDTDLGVYASAPQPGHVDDAVLYFVRDLGMRLPLSLLLTTRMPQELSRRVKTVDYVEYTEIMGPGAHHIAARTSDLDFQVWIADGDEPLPLRIVLTYTTEPGLPQFQAQFIDWDTGFQAPAGSFNFEPPADATRIIFAVQGSAVQESAGQAPNVPPADAQNGDQP